MASFEKTQAKLAYSDGSETLGFAFSVAMASSVTVVSLAMKGEFRRKCLQSPQRIQLI